MTVEGSTSRPIAKRSSAHRTAICFQVSSRSAQRFRRYWNPIRIAPACACLLFFVVSTVAIAQQQVARVSVSSDALPDAPEPQTGVQQGAEQSWHAEGNASIAGIVHDTAGALVAGAQVSLTQRDGRNLHTVESGANGDFTFTKLPAGSYLVIVNAKSFALFTSEEITLSPLQSFIIPNITLNVGANVAEVTVRPTEVIAAEQIKQEEKQRLLGILPDFYVSYVWDAAPLNSKQKYSMALRDILDPTTFIGVSIGAGIQQARNTFPGFGQGAAGYGERWGALFANGKTSDFLSRAVFPSVFHQDPRYFYQGSATSTWSRTKHAIGYAFVARSDSGHLMPNYSLFLGNLSSGALSNVYYPDSSRGAGLIFENAALGFAGRITQDLAHEFLFQHLTKHVLGKGKPSNDTESP